MSRTRKALIITGFSYTQFALAIVSGILLIPLILGNIGARTYGLWMVMGEVLTYVSVLDLGVFAVLPWMIAEADGRKDRLVIGRLITRGLVVGCTVSIAYILIFSLSWWLLPTLLNLTEADLSQLSKPLTLLVLITAAAYPLKVFNAVLVGLQDVAFSGALSVTQACFSIGLTLTLLLTGCGLYALVAAAAVPALMVPLAGLLRTRYIAPDLFHSWSMPTFKDIVSLFSGSVGAWLGGFGWQLVATSNSLVITYLGYPEWVPVYVCTAKLGSLLTQMCWMMPDSALVGLAQLHGEGKKERVSYVVTTMLQLHLLMSGAAACIVLALNPAFVNWWVGPRFFGGLLLNGLLAISLIWSSLVHGLICSSAVLGDRLQVGCIQIINGVLHLVLAVSLGTRWGLPGIAAATLIGSTLSTFPFSLWLLGNVTRVRSGWLLKHLFSGWLVRIVPLLALASFLGAFGLLNSIVWLVGGGIGVCLIYIWWMRSLYQLLPLDPRLMRWLTALRLLRPLKVNDATSL